MIIHIIIRYICRLGVECYKKEVVYMKAMDARKNSNGRIKSGTLISCKTKRNYILNLVGGKKETICCTPEALRMRLRDSTKTPVHYVSY